MQSCSRRSNFCNSRQLIIGLIGASKYWWTF
jgi:hypothetical protein